MQSNTPNGQRTKMTIELESAMLKALPESVRNWLLYDAPADYDVSQIFRAYKQGFTEERLMEELRGEGRVRTMRAYGDMHPSLPYPAYEFSRGRNPYRPHENSDYRKAA